MAKVLQFRRGTTAELASITGAVGELFVDTTKDTVVVHDGSTQGGFPLQRELVSGTSIKTINGTSLLGSGDITISGGSGDATWGSITGTLSSQTDLQNALNAKQATLVSGTNIKTINGTSILGSGDIEISGGSGDTFDQSLNTTDDVNFNKVTVGGKVLATEQYVDSSLFTSESITYNTTDYSSGGIMYFGFGSPGIYIDSSRFTSDPNVIRNVPIGTVFTFKTNQTGDTEYTFTTTGLISNDTLPGTSNLTGVSAPAITFITYSNVVPKYEQKLISGTNIKTINNQSILGSGNITIEGGEGGSADLSQIAEDVLPLFSEVYDIGSTEKRWFDGYFSNKVDINGAEILGSEDGVVIPTAALIDQLLISDNMITPDASTASQYFGDMGELIVNGNLSIDGQYLTVPVVQSMPDIPGIPAGTIDTSFNYLNISPPTVSILRPDGKILGYSYANSPDNKIYLINSDGSLDTSFVTGEFTDLSSNPDTVFTIALQSDGKILAGGDFDRYDGITQRGIVRINSNGSIDNTFNPQLQNGNFGFLRVNSITIQPDGKILVGGIFGGVNNTTQNNITRLNPDGSLDSSFNIGTGFNSSVTSIAIQPDGKILAIGFFTSYNGTTQNYITRLNPDGSLDSSFNIGTGLNNLPHIITIQSDGKILVGGDFTSYNGTVQNRITRLNPDGSLDSSFNIGTGFDSRVVAILPHPNDIILVGGFFGSYNDVQFSNDVFGLIALNLDGSQDTSFYVSGVYYSSGDDFLIQPDGDVIIVGGIVLNNFSDSKAVYRVVVGTAVPATPGQTVPTRGEVGMIRYNNDIGAFQAYNESGWELLVPAADSAPSTLTKDGDGFVDIDFADVTLGTFTNTGGASAFAFRGINYLAGSSVTIRVIENSENSGVFLNFPSDWVFVGTKPEELATGKTALLTVTSFGTTEADCVAQWWVQS
jgi:uncharacterized delta-60 repeat protein